MLELGAAAELIRSRRLSPVELIDDALACIEQREPTVRAFATLVPGQARAAAREAEREIAAGRYRGPLHGIPIGVKDLIDTADVPTTWGSAVHAERVPAEDAEAWARLRAQGAILIGKTVTHEMGCGTLCPPTSNPLDVQRGPGGSSGGSAAALAAGFCLGALGTDTGGSVRIPAACTGTVGFKPTFGVVPTRGAMIASWTLDHVGPMARNVDGVATLYSALTGVPLTGHDTVRGLRLGVAGGWFREHVQDGVLTAFDAATRVLADAGAQLVQVDLDFLKGAARTGSLIALPELASLHARDLEQRELLDEQVRLNLERGLVEPAVDYLGALHARQVMTHAMDDLFAANALDALLTPTLPMTAARKDCTSVDFGGGYSETPEDAYVRFCVGFNITGSPALSVPCGTDADGMPVGLHIAARPSDDAMVLRIGRAFERAA